MEIKSYSFNYGVLTPHAYSMLAPVNNEMVRMGDIRQYLIRIE